MLSILQDILVETSVEVLHIYRTNALNYKFMRIYDARIYKYPFFMEYGVIALKLP